jgi:hypothetical protein
MSARPGPALLALIVVLCSARAGAAQMVVTPSLSMNLHTTPGFVDLDDVPSQRHAGFGVAVSRVTRHWLGIEGDVTMTPSAFSGGDLVTSSSLLAVTGSVLALVPERWRLRPYVSAGIGVVRIRSMDVAGLFTIDSTHGAVTAGFGTWVWLGPRVGFRTGLDFLRTVDEVELEAFETWQPSVGVAIRF